MTDSILIDLPYEHVSASLQNRDTLCPRRADRGPGGHARAARLITREKEVHAQAHHPGCLRDRRRRLHRHPDRRLRRRRRFLAALDAATASPATTTVSHSGGTPLSLNAKSGYAPLKVNSSKVVTNLNTDKVDGYSASSFAMRSAKTGTVVADYPGEAAFCPAGTVVTGGGGMADGGLDCSGPGMNASGTGFADNSWQAIGYDSTWGDALSFAECYSPSGAAVVGDIATATASSLTKGQNDVP